MRENNNVIALAADVAGRAHAGQVDKSGVDYITHPERVAGNVRRLFPEAPDEAVAVAWLHDAVEDTQVELPALLALGFPSAVADGVDAMTKRAGDSTEAYFARVNGNPWARMVKTADLMDNTDPARVALLDEATAARLRLKYGKAHRLLEAPGGSRQGIYT